MTSPSIEVGELIRRARRRRGWTVEDLISAMGNRHRKQTIHQWESGRGVGVLSLLELVTVMPELGDHLIGMIRRAQQR
jgi:transcriptional regulator with XRE-family HTH domain